MEVALFAVHSIPSFVVFAFADCRSFRLVKDLYLTMLLSTSDRARSVRAKLALSGTPGSRGPFEDCA
jgi:hypothetical protein